MHALALRPGIMPRIVDRPEPQIKATDEVKIRVLQVGICHTDHDLIRGSYGRVPANATDIVLGHEMLGQVIEVGSEVTTLKVGDYAVSTVRRSCEKCEACYTNRADSCCSGEYLSRGITGLDGFQCERVVDKERYIVRLPQELARIGVLTEPFAVIEKALQDASAVASVRVPARGVAHEWFSGKRCLIAGLGTMGLLAALLLRLRGAEVYGLDIWSPESMRPHWLTGIGGNYLDGRQLRPEHIAQSCGLMDLVIEAAGVATLEVQLLHVLARNGVYVLIGLPNEGQVTAPLDIALVRRTILHNQTLLGSINASRMHFQWAVRDLELAFACWNGQIAKLISAHYPMKDFSLALERMGGEVIKVVIDWD